MIIVNCDVVHLLLNFISPFLKYRISSSCLLVQCSIECEEGMESFSNSTKGRYDQINLTHIIVCSNASVYEGNKICEFMCGNAEEVYQPKVNFEFKDLYKKLPNIFSCVKSPSSNKYFDMGSNFAMEQINSSIYKNMHEMSDTMRSFQRERVLSNGLVVTFDYGQTVDFLTAMKICEFEGSKLMDVIEEGEFQEISQMAKDRGYTQFWTTFQSCVGQSNHSLLLKSTANNSNSTFEIIQCGKNKLNSIYDIAMTKLNFHRDIVEIGGQSPNGFCKIRPKFVQVSLKDSIWLQSDIYQKSRVLCISKREDSNKFRKTRRSIFLRSITFLKGQREKWACAWCSMALNKISQLTASTLSGSTIYDLCVRHLTVLFHEATNHMCRQLQNLIAETITAGGRISNPTKVCQMVKLCAKTKQKRSAFNILHNTAASKIPPHAAELLQKVVPKSKKNSKCQKCLYGLSATHKTVQTIANAILTPLSFIDFIAPEMTVLNGAVSLFESAVGPDQHKSICRLFTLCHQNELED